MKAIFYTDGGARPSRGAGGWGIHGFFFMDEKPKQGSGCPWYVTNRGYFPKSGPEAEPRTEVTVLKYVDGFGGFVGDVTNNNAELEALEKTLDLVLAESDINDVLIYADSRYVLDGTFKWLNGWVMKDFRREDGTEILNRQQWQKIYDRLKACQQRKIAVAGDWVMGHSGNLGNETSDDYATQGVIYSQAGEERVLSHKEEGELQYSDPKGYWKESIDFNRLICGNRIVLVWDRDDKALSIDGYNSYFMYETTDKDPEGRPDSLNGKASANTCLGIAVLKANEPVLDIILERQRSLQVKFPVGLAKVRTDIITRPTIYNGILTSKGLFGTQNGQDANLFYLFDKERPISTELRPLGLAYRLLDEYVDLLTVLKDVMEDPTKDKSNLFITDVTESFYFDAGKKKPDIKLKPEITQSLQYLTLKVKYLDNTGPDLVVKEKDQHLAMGLDIPKRNTLSAIASETTKLYFVTWPFTDRMYRHAFVAITEDGAMIWSSVYSNYGLFR